jgi:hypothetical protein
MRSLLPLVSLLFAVNAFAVNSEMVGSANLSGNANATTLCISDTNDANARAFVGRESKNGQTELASVGISDPASSLPIQWEVDLLGDGIGCITDGTYVYVIVRDLGIELGIVRGSDGQWMGGENLPLARHATHIEWNGDPSNHSLIVYKNAGANDEKFTIDVSNVGNPVVTNAENIAATVYPPPFEGPYVHVGGAFTGRLDSIRGNTQWTWVSSTNDANEFQVSKRGIAQFDDYNGDGIWRIGIIGAQDVAEAGSGSCVTSASCPATRTALRLRNLIDAGSLPQSWEYQPLVEIAWLAEDDATLDNCATCTESSHEVLPAFIGGDLDVLVVALGTRDVLDGVDAADLGERVEDYLNLATFTAQLSLIQIFGASVPAFDIALEDFSSTTPAEVNAVIRPLFVDGDNWIETTFDAGDFQSAPSAHLLDGDGQDNLADSLYDTLISGVIN